jgi:hypothetical protein
VRLRPYLEMTVDEYWSRVIDVYGAVKVGVPYPTVIVAASVIALMINRMTFRFMLLLILELKKPLLARWRLLPANSGNSKMQYDQCTPLVTSDDGVDARSEVAEGRVAAATDPKSQQGKTRGHISWRRLSVLVARYGGADGGHATARLKIIGDKSTRHYAEKNLIRVENLERGDVDEASRVVITLQDQHPERINTRAAGVQT